ncbi:MAG TPA: hypothetical protein VJ579_03715 [Candidatus Paceibacterota bacterium]|nr:hypothetical protein [Candidatus Paceibacterota bacterium]
MTESDAGASFVGQGTENVFVTLDVAAQLTNFSPEYIERLCRDGYVPCAGGKDGLIFPHAGELLKVLNINLPPAAVITYVPPQLISVPLLSREELLTKTIPPAVGLVGNQPVGISSGSSTLSAPLRRGALSFNLVSDEEEAPPPMESVNNTPVPPAPMSLELEVPPSPAPKALPMHWPVKTSSDVTAHFDDAPLMPPLSMKPISAPPAETVDILPAPFFAQFPEVSQRAEVIVEPEHDLAVRADNAIQIEPEEGLALPEIHALAQHEDESIALPESEAIMVPAVEALVQPETEEIILAPDQNLIQTVAQSIDVGTVVREEVEDERPSVFPPSVEQVSTAADASWYTPDETSMVAGGLELTEEEGTPVKGEEENTQEAIQEIQKNTSPVVVIDPTPPQVERDISDRILAEAVQSKVTPSPLNESVEDVIAEQQVVTPIVAVPHYAVAQLTPSMHPLALPPRVVPFATMVPAAYPQVAAVFTQPHARASEWLPWMRTSHFSRTAVQVATNPEVHPSYPRYSKPKGQEGTPVAPIEVSNGDESRVSAPVSSQKVFVSVVGKPVAPLRVPVEKHVAPPPPPPPRTVVDSVVAAIPPAEDAWDEMLAPQARRDETIAEKYEEIPHKSREELLKEVSADIKDSWDASFLAGLEAA